MVTTVGCAQGPPLLTWISFGCSMNNDYIHYKMWDEITFPFPNSTVQPGMWSRTHAGIKVNPCQQMGPLKKT